MFGCILTHAHKKRINGYKETSNEFRHFKDGQNFIKGIYVGKVNFKNKKYEHVQFANLLDGENRYLNIYFKEKNYEFPYLFESNTKLEGAIAYAFVHKYFEHNPKSVDYKLFYPSTKEITSPNFFIEAMNIAQSTISYPLIVFKLDFSNIYTQSITKITWRKNAEDNFVVERNFSPSDDNTIMPKIKFKKRSLLKLYLWYLAYFLIIPFDLLTCPIQLLLFRNIVK